jgi:hypothetical protein
MKGSFSDGTHYRSVQKTPPKTEDAHFNSKIDHGLISDESNQKQLFVPRMEVSNARVIDFNQNDSQKDQYIRFLENSLK